MKEVIPGNLEVDPIGYSNSIKDGKWKPIYGFEHRHGKGTKSGAVYYNGTVWRCNLCGHISENFTDDFLPISMDHRIRSLPKE